MAVWITEAVSTILKLPLDFTIIPSCLRGFPRLNQAQVQKKDFDELAH